MTDNADPNPPPGPDALAAFQSQTLAAAIDPSAKSETNATLAATLVSLHNTGAIDVLSLASWPALADLPGHRAHMLERLLNLVLPGLTTSAPAMVAFTAAMVAPVRKSMHVFLDGVRGWLTANPSQADEVVALALQGDVRALELLSIALQTRGDLTNIRTIISDHDDERRDHAIHALGLTPHPKPTAIATTVAAMVTTSTGVDDPVKARVLEAVTNLFTRAGAVMTPDAVTLTEQLLATGGDATRHQAARALFHADGLGNAARTVLLEGLLGVNPDNAGTLGEMDLALSKMIGQAHQSVAIDFVARLICGADGRIRLSAFEITTSEILSAPNGVLADTVIDWLLLNNPTLSTGLVKVIQRIGGTPVVLRPELKGRGFSGPRLVSLCRKAIGYFHLQPVTAASLIAAALRVVPKANIDEIETLLFEGLLVNYSGSLEEYLSALPRSDKARAAVQRALTRKTAYIQGLQAPGRINELCPSELRRQAEQERHSDEMRRSFAAARCASPLLGLVKSSTLLYGRQSMTFMIDFNGQRQSSEIMLQSHGTTYEVPRALKLDPMGLEEMTLTFRATPVAP